MKHNKKLLAAGLVGTAASAFAEGTTPSYTVPQGVTDAIGNAQAAAEGLANAALPGVAAIGLAFVGIAVVWLLVRAIRKGAR